MTALEAGNLDGLVTFLVCMMIGPPILLSIIAFNIKRKYPKTATALYILATVYLIVGLGICAGIS